VRAPAAASFFLAAVIGASCGTALTRAAIPNPVTARPTATPTPTPPPAFWVDAPIVGDPTPIRAQVPATGVTVEAEQVVLLAPSGDDGPRRVGIQVGHWKVEEAPTEFPNLRFQGGASVRGAD
jgi:hypothetical protein